VLGAEGTAVTLARNVTDVDEALFAEAVRRGEHYDQLAALQKFSFDRTMTALRVRTPSVEPSARQSVHRVIELVQALLDQDQAYVVDGHVFGRTRAAAQGLEPGHARELSEQYGDAPDDDRKENPFDVTIWHRTATNDISWPSPWGPGRPGWHAECAAMVLGTFGSGVDLHAGGADLTYPHHACEKVLAEAVTGVTPFARAWLQVGTVLIDGAKMAKSTGNLVLVDELLAEHSPAAIRLLCLARPWAQPWEYRYEELAQAEQTLDALFTAAARAGRSPAGARRVQDLLLADLNVPAALDVALGDGGFAARHLLDVLALS
jgi:cysteinyl-tRNA synthetase